MKQKVERQDVADLLKLGAKHLRMLNVDSASREDLRVIEQWDRQLSTIRSILALKETGTSLASMLPTVVAFSH
jgi:hypothetical protein